MAKLIDAAKAAHGAGNGEEAVRLCRKVLTSSPKDGAALELMGTALFEMGRWREAAEALQKAIGRAGEAAPLHSMAGIANLRLQQVEKAVKHFDRAVEACRDRTDELDAMGRLLYEQGALSHAEACMRRAAAIDPHNASWLNNLALILKDDGRREEAAQAWEQALRLSPEHTGALTNLGVMRFDQRRLDEAADLLERALKLQPLPEAAWHLGLVYLLQGRYRDGFALYEARFAVRRSRPKDYPQPLWDGTPAPEKSLVVYHEQGLGDTIQFARFLAAARERVGRLLFVCQAPLARLLASLPGVDVMIESESLAERDLALSADLQVSLLSLPHVLGVTLEDLPGAERYVRADPAHIDHWQARMADDWGLRVGIAWAGNPVNPRDGERSCTLMDFAPLAQVDGVSLYSLQKGHGSEQTADFLTDFTSDLHDFADTAALVANLDLVITVDTAVAHLAAAMGKPVWTLHSKHCDWRWMTDRADTPWYPGMRLFRQSTDGDWTPVVNDVATALRRWLSPAEPRFATLVEA